MSTWGGNKSADSCFSGFIRCKRVQAWTLSFRFSSILLLDRKKIRDFHQGLNFSLMFHVTISCPDVEFFFVIIVLHGFFFSTVPNAEARGALLELHRSES